MRKQFNLQDWLKDKSQKVETRDKRIIHNIWPVKEPPIVNGKSAEVCALIDGEDDALVFFAGGKYLPINAESPFDLFIITHEPELSEFEKALESFYNHHLQVCTYDNQGTVENSLHDGAANLLSIAREQFIKDGYVIEKKAFHDVVENISDKHRAEMSVEYSLHCKIEDGTRHAIMNWEAFQKVAQKFIDIGKAEALKDLPKWRKFAPNINDSFSEQRICKELENSVMRVDVSGYCWVINREELNKLPKESEK